METKFLSFDGEVFLAVPSQCSPLVIGRDKDAVDLQPVIESILDLVYEAQDRIEPAKGIDICADRNDHAVSSKQSLRSL